jgi:serine/threonine protein kinase
MTLDDPIASRGYQFKHGDKPLDGYTIQRAAGRGGFGEVYYAVSDSKKDVALKVINTYEQIELRGTTQCINLKDSHLVTIFDIKYGQDGRPWIIMEFVNGPSLAELIKAAPTGLGAAKSSFFVAEIARGLTYLHGCGIVHRDLKPGNIFYENGQIKIGDYGLSKSISMTAFSGQTIAVGTLHYMAPEIGDGRYGATADIYALGVILYEMITGKVPFAGSSWGEVIIKHARGEVNLDGVEEPFKSVIAKAMAKDPAGRYQSAMEMAEALCGPQPAMQSVSQFAAPLPRMKPPTVRPPASPRPERRPSKILWWLIAFSGVLVGAFAAMFLMFVSSPRPVVMDRPTTSLNSESVDVLTADAESGNTTSMIQLGEQYRGGIGVHQDFAQALAWDHKAADAGDKFAFYQIGYAYSIGQGVPRDYMQAMDWYLKGANAGDVRAMCGIGDLYDRGLGVQRDEGQALAWYRKASFAGGPFEREADQWLAAHNVDRGPKP